MDELAHDGNGSQPDLLGYTACGNEHCGAVVPDVVALRTKGMCPDCFLAEIGPALRVIEVRNQGRRIEARLPRKSYASPDKGDRGTDRAAGRARRAALNRLRDIYPDMYATLLAEERLKYGLEPFPIDPSTLTTKASEVLIDLEMALVYAALDDHGVDVDAFEDPTAARADGSLG